jgi:ABC-type Fe3+-hydroxamate transport system substrate-binding protein
LTVAGNLKAVTTDGAAFLVDAVGTQHRPAEGDFKIACLVPSITELLFDLNLGKRVVARTGYCIHPEEFVKAVPKVGGTKQINFEKLKKLAPSHIVLNLEENTKECALTLKEFIPNLVVTHPTKFRDNFLLFELIGGVFDAKQSAASLDAELTKQITKNYFRLRPGRRPLNVLYLIWKDPWMSVAPTTYIADVLKQAGLFQIGLPSEREYPTVDFLLVDWANVDAVFLSSEPYSFSPEDQRSFVVELLRLTSKPIPVLMVDGELMSWYGSRALKTPAYLNQLRFELDALLKNDG